MCIAVAGWDGVGMGEVTRLDHRDVVGTVADGHGLLRRNTQFFRQCDQRIGFKLRIDYRSQHFTGQFAVANFQLISRHRHQF